MFFMTDLRLMALLFYLFIVAYFDLVFQPHVVAYGKEMAVAHTS